MRKMGKHIPGLIVTLVVLITAIVFAVMLLNMKVIPTKFIAVIGLVMLVLIMIVGALVWGTDGKIRFVVGVILAAVFAAVFILGSMYVYKTHSTLAGISGVNTEVTEVGIYVRADDSADSIEATADYVYGVLTDLDRANSDKAIQEVDSETGKTVQVQEYAGLTELVDGLLNGQTGAIVLNSAYLSVIEEMDGYSDISSRIKELTVKKVETTIEPQETEAKAEESTNDGSVYTIFISGIDSRSGLVAKSRSDSNIIATVHTATRQVLLVSTPRDSFVPLSLSGGQRQKMGIARALLSKAEYMIFDEATSSVDPESEKEIWDTISRLAHTRTLIIISHRMSSVRSAHCIYVLKDGQVAQQGDHEALMAQDGLYRQLVLRQQTMEVTE